MPLHRACAPLLLAMSLIAGCTAQQKPLAENAYPEGSEYRESDADRAVRAKLDANLRMIQSDGQTLDRVLAYLADGAGTPLEVHWKALEAAGIRRTSPVTVSLREVPYRKVLHTVLAQVGGSANLGYDIRDGKVRVSTINDLIVTGPPETHTYDVRNMTMPANIPINLSDPIQKSFHADRVQDLMETIKAAVMPDSWKSAGGKIGTISEKDGILTITQTRDNHRAVHQLLEQLRETRAINIAVETRLILVSPKFLDDFRDDLRFAWDLSLGTQPRAAGETQPASKPPASNASIIDTWTLTHILQATQADRRTIQVSGAVVTIPNGSTGTVVASYQPGIVPTGGNSSKAFSPMASASVSPTVSADRRYIVTGVENLAAGPLGRTPATPDLRIVERTTSANVVSIPDGGTLLINLGPIPGDPDKHLGLMLIRPNIVIHREVENDLYGPGYDKPTSRPSL